MSAVLPRLDEDGLAGQAAAIAAAALTLARRFAAGATLWCLAPGAAHHARHVAVEFVHPVVVGTRSLPAVAVVVPGGGDLAAARALVRPGDVALAIGAGEDPTLADLLASAAARGVATLLLAGGPVPATGAADHTIDTGPDEGGGTVLAYHLLWELTHVVFEHPGLLPICAGRCADPAAGSDPTPAEPTGFLYPFIDGDERDAGVLLADLAESVRQKVAASVELSDRTLGRNADALAAAAAAMVERFAAGGRLLVFGNGGSSTDAAATASAFGRSVATIDLGADPAVLTALGNDVGFDVVFARQVGALAQPRDVALGISTSGGSANVLAAFAAARDRGLLTVGVSGYGGGAMAIGDDLDHHLVVDADSVHRIQEAQGALLRRLCSDVFVASGGT